MPDVAPPDGLAADLCRKRSRAVEILGREKGVVVALSGGVDSGVLLHLAIEALGRARVIAITGRSPAVPEADLADAAAVAAAVGAAHEVVETHEMERPGYRANAGDRCYHCRAELFEVLESVRRERGFSAVAYGAIIDDLGEHRPGMAAARERGILAPLAEAGLGKEEVRALAARAGLPVRDKPASPCLASRIPVGQEVTPPKLARIGRAESALRGLGLEIFRVRDHGEVARLELGPGETEKVLEPALRRKVVAVIQEEGFRFVALDLEGYRSGSLDPDRPVDSGRTGSYRIRPARGSGQ